MNIYWEPEFPNKGEDVIIYADVSETEYFKNSYQMNIHLSVDKKEYSTHAMLRDYSKGLFTWTYKYKINKLNIYNFNLVYICPPLKTPPLFETLIRWTVGSCYIEGHEYCQCEVAGCAVKIWTPHGC